MSTSTLKVVCFLLACPALAAPQRPSASDANELLERARTVALAYGRSLPNFVCTETVRRSSAAPNPRQLPLVNWRLNDTLTVKLSYFDQKEDHKLMLIDGKPSDLSFESLGGAIGIGEFGGMLDGIFTPSSEAEFHWDSHKNIRGRRVAVYSYVVPQAHSSYLLSTSSRTGPRQALVGYRGVVEMEEDTGAVLRFTYEADRIPKDLELQYALTTVDYDSADVGGAAYLLPLRSETELRGAVVWMRNQMDFRDYNKYASDSKISYEPGK
jgi:hypothetical protein